MKRCWTLPITPKPGPNQKPSLFFVQMQSSTRLVAVARKSVPNARRNSSALRANSTQITHRIWFVNRALKMRRHPPPRPTSPNQPAQARVLPSICTTAGAIWNVRKRFVLLSFNKSITWLIKVKTCPNCKTQTTSLWRKFKSADEVQRELEKKEGGKDREIDTSRPEFEGELGCNPCVLYWKLHGVSTKTRILNKYSWILNSRRSCIWLGSPLAQ